MQRTHRRAHAAIWRWLGPLLPMALGAALLLKLAQRPVPPNVELAPPALSQGGVRP